MQSIPFATTLSKWRLTDARVELAHDDWAHGGSNSGAASSYAGCVVFKLQIGEFARRAVAQR